MPCCEAEIQPNVRHMSKILVALRKVAFVENLHTNSVLFCEYCFSDLRIVSIESCLFIITYFLGFDAIIPAREH
jgi:hypothetical protein